MALCPILFRHKLLRLTLFETGAFLQNCGIVREPVETPAIVQGRGKTPTNFGRLGQRTTHRGEPIKFAMSLSTHPLPAHIYRAPAPPTSTKRRCQTPWILCGRSAVRVGRQQCPNNGRWRSNLVIAGFGRNELVDCRGGVAGSLGSPDAARDPIGMDGRMGRGTRDMSFTVSRAPDGTRVRRRYNGSAIGHTQ